MTYICGERLSQRLHIRVDSNMPRSVSIEEKRDLYTFLQLRISHSWGKWLQRIFTPPKNTVFVSKEKENFPVESLLAPQKQQTRYPSFVLCIRAVFSLFVAIFYQNSEDPNSEFHVTEQSPKRDERDGARVSLFSSLLFWKKNNLVNDWLIHQQCLWKRFQLIMEYSYV